VGLGAAGAVLAKLVPLLPQLSAGVERLNLVAFYLTGAYYQLSRRVARIRYVRRSLRHRSGTQTMC
jgi:hypothetical protein